jgi:rod shape determining protein RodA
MNASVLLRQLRSHFDWVLVGTIVAIAAVGLVNLYSATRAAPVHGLFEAHVRFLIVGLGLFFVCAIVDYHVWLRFSWLVLLVGVLAVVEVHFLGVTVKGSRRWLGVGSVRLQPSEFVKIAVIFALARFVQDREGDDIGLVGLAARFGAFIATILFIAWQPDLGTAMLVALICVSVLTLAARRIWLVAAALGGVAAAAPFIWAYALKDYQKKRILTFVDPSTDPSGAGWHARQSIFAVGSGRLAGKGYLHGTQNQLNFLPEHWTDFPFSVWAEEWGFAGAVVLLGLYLFLILWILNIASEARDRFGATLCVGVAAMIFWHVIVNIGMVTGLAPVVGVTLPLVSSGGSSVLTMLIGLGLVASVSVRRYTPSV